MQEQWLASLMGGVFIGGASVLLYMASGRIAGISGILNGALWPKKQDFSWRAAFIIGLLGGGYLVSTLKPDSLTSTLATSNSQLILAGLLVGFGTVMGSGCTSGHGVCGIGRFSPRSLAATAVFILTGMIVVGVLR